MNFHGAVFCHPKSKKEYDINDSLRVTDIIPGAVNNTKGEIPLNNNYRGYPQQNRMRQREGCDDNCLSCCNFSDRATAPFPECYGMAMAYVPFQQWGEVYSCDKALMRGTLFPCLDLPFTMGCCK